MYYVMCERVRMLRINSLSNDLYALCEKERDWRQIRPGRWLHTLNPASFRMLVVFFVAFAVQNIQSVLLKR